MVEIQCHINIKKNGTVFIDSPKTFLLRAIDKHGSLSSAAKHLKISYQHAWNMMNEMNRIAPEPLVTKQRGGTNGGGARLTPYGQRVLKEYRYIESHVLLLVEKLNVEIGL